MVVIEYLIFSLYLFFQFVAFNVFYDISEIDFNANTRSRGFSAKILKQVLSFWFTVNSIIMIAAILNTLFVKRFSIIFGIMIILVTALHIFLCIYFKNYVRKLKIKEVLTVCSDREYDVSAIESYIRSYNADKICKELILPLHNLIAARDIFKTTEAQEKYDEVVLNEEIEIFMKNLEYVINEEKENHEKVRQQKENIAKISDEKILDNIKKNYKGLEKYYE